MISIFDQAKRKGNMPMKKQKHPIGNKTTVHEPGLPLPYAHYPMVYGTFVGFSQEPESEVFLCSCAREAAGNFLEATRMKWQGRDGSPRPDVLAKDFPRELAEDPRFWDGDPMEKLPFRDGICHKCSGILPAASWCHPMYLSAAERALGWYFKQDYCRYGIDYKIPRMTPMARLHAPAAILMSLEKADGALKANDQEAAWLYWGAIRTHIQEDVRKAFGNPKIGNGKHLQEQELYWSVREQHPDTPIIRNYRPAWLEGLELDIYLPDEGLAFERQGEQHYRPVEHWGGEEKLEEQKEHDARKRKICEGKGIRLVEIGFGEDASPERIRALASAAGKDPGT